MSAKIKSFWSRYDVRFAGAAVVAGVFGLGLLGAAIWVALMIWNRDFRRQFTMWYKAWVLAGLVIEWLAEYPVSAALNVPPSWVGTLIMVAAAVLALTGSRPMSGRHRGMPAHWQ